MPGSDWTGGDEDVGGGGGDESSGSAGMGPLIGKVEAGLVPGV